MWSWWNSADAVSSLAWWARWIAAIAAVIAVVLGHRLSALQNAKQQPRTITPEQKNAFLRATKPSPKGKVHVVFNSPEAEISDFAERILDMLNSAGFDTDNTLSQGIGGKPRAGIVLLIQDTKHPPAHVEILRSVLHGIGIEARIEEEPESHLSPEEVECLVGNRPN
jgi:hypothetical protein